MLSAAKDRAEQEVSLDENCISLRVESGLLILICEGKSPTLDLISIYLNSERVFDSIIRK